MARGVLGYRWRICALLFFATTINYIDRQILGILKPILDNELGWSETDFGLVVLSFQAAYAIGLVSAGRLLDLVGTRLGYAIAMTLWSLATAAHALMGSALGFVVARFALGIGEAGNYPAALKAVAEWFPQRERAFATGLFNAGSNVGAMVTPVIVPIVAVAFGWQAAFILAGALGLLWLVYWLWAYRPPAVHPRLSEAELHLIQEGDGREGPRVPWRSLLGYRATWAYAIAKFLTDPVWWFFLFWLPDFLVKVHGLEVTSFGAPLLTVYLLADVGSIAGGWGSSRLIRQGLSVNRARKLVMLGCALLALPVATLSGIEGLWPAVLLISLAVAAHQAWSANLLTLASDQFPKEAVGSVIGIGGTVGAVGGMLMAYMVGRILDLTGSYDMIFAVAALAYLAALLLIHLLVPNLDRRAIEQGSSSD